MVLPRARRVATALIEGFDLAAPPNTLEQTISLLLIEQDATLENSLAQEHAERIAQGVAKFLLAHLNERVSLGQVCRFEFNSSSSDYIQGACFVAPNDSPQLASAKLRRIQHSNYSGLLRNLSPRQFEAVCRGLLVEMGSADAALTRSSNDQGIDFFGKLSLQGRLAQTYHLPSFDAVLSVWLVGQAKHYQNTQVATPDIRELVGSVELARAGAFADSGAALAGLELRRCDPVFYLFFTTGSISADGWRLLQRTGVIAMDGLTLAAFLADSGVGVDDAGQVDDAKFESWLLLHGE